MPHRFFCPHLGETGSVTLEDTEAHHLAHVLRHQPDDIVELFNGEGLVATCRISRLLKRTVEIEVLTSRRDPEPQKRLFVATAVPKGDRFDFLIEKLTELGVHRLIPLTTFRSIVDPRTSKLDKLRQTVITACKQSGRNHLMSILPVTPWASFLKDIVPGNHVLIAHPQGEKVDTAMKSVTESPQPIVVAIGPEGGFSEEEVQSALALGSKAVHLGNQILRIETAGIALAAKLLL